MAHQLYERTEGHPFFLVHAVDDLVRTGTLAEVDGVWQFEGGLQQVMRTVPATGHEIVTQRLSELSTEEQQILGAGSVVGVGFSAAAIAAGVGSEVRHVEAVCERLARRRLFLTSDGVSAWPDGTVVQCFRFHHALYQHVLYAYIPEGQRCFLHRTIGARLERGFADQPEAIAATLALHFQRGRDEARAQHYAQHPSERATTFSPQVLSRSHRHAGSASA